MNEAERLAKSARAKQAWDEFVGPLIDDWSNTLSMQITKVATTDLSSDGANKLRVLSHALRGVAHMRQAMKAQIDDGPMARATMKEVQKIADMPYQQRRWAEMLG